MENIKFSDLELSESIPVKAVEELVCTIQAESYSSHMADVIRLNRNGKTVASAPSH
jgi:hypothetical protein